MKKHFKRIVILSLFFLLVSSFGSNAFIQRQQTENYVFGLQIVNWPGFTVTPNTLNSIVPICVRKHYTTQVLIRDAQLDWTYFIGKIDQGDICFQPDYTSIIAIREDKNGHNVYFFFRAKDTTGSGNFQYGLHFYDGQIVGGTPHEVPCEQGNSVWRWPPQQFGMDTIIEFKKWEIIVEGNNKKDKKGQGKKCVDYGSFVEDQGVPVNFIVTNYGPPT